MKNISTEDLVVGQIYFDVDNKKMAIGLELISREKVSESNSKLCFNPLPGYKEYYCPEPDGTILFNSPNTDEWWYV